MSKLGAAALAVVVAAVAALLLLRAGLPTQDDRASPRACNISLPPSTPGRTIPETEPPTSGFPSPPPAAPAPYVEVVNETSPIVELPGGQVLVPPGPRLVITAYASCFNELHVYDPRGRHIGFNREEGRFEVNVEGAELRYANNVTAVVLEIAPEGTYRIELRPTCDSGEYVLQVVRSVGGAVTAFQTYAGNLTGENLSWEISTYDLVPELEVRPDRAGRGELLTVRLRLRNVGAVNVTFANATLLLSEGWPCPGGVDVRIEVNSTSYALSPGDYRRACGPDHTAVWLDFERGLSPAGWEGWPCPGGVDVRIEVNSTSYALSPGDYRRACGSDHAAVWLDLERGLSPVGWEGAPPAALEEGWSLVVEFRLRVPEEARPGRVELEVIVPYVQGSFGYYAFRLSRARVTVEVAP